MEFTDASGVRIAYQVTGSGDPATCFVPGLTQSIADVRPFGSGVAGSRVFMDLRGQGASAAPQAEPADAWTYRALVSDVTAVADTTRASRAVGVSLGASTLLSLISRDPSRFDRVVLALPAGIDEPRPASVMQITDGLADAVAAHDPIEAARRLLLLQPSAVRSKTTVQLWARRQAAELVGTAVVRVLRTLPHQVPVADADALRSFDRPVLVLAQRDDDAHPVDVAERLAELFPRAEIVVSDEPWIWGARERLRDVMSGFLNP